MSQSPSANKNPQAEQMADESMVRCLAAQAQAVWPQERLLIDRYGLAADIKVLDIACGTGEFSERFARHKTGAHVSGVDLEAAHVGTAIERCKDISSRTEFGVGDAFALDFADREFDFVAARHFLQAIPQPELAMREAIRVTKSGGRIHVVAEDYSMMHFHPTGDLDCDDFWRHGPITFAAKTGTDLRGGRKMFTMMRELGLEDVTVEHIVVDTTRVPRATFAAIWTAWRDGYSDAIATKTKFTADEARAYFDAMIAAIEDPNGYGLWNLPVVTGLVPVATR
jgi:SAM-dependent methyltransferase